MDEFKVESNVPLAPIQKPRLRSRFISLGEKMDVGDSVVLPNRSAANSAWQHLSARYQDRRYTLRKVSEVSYRLYRTK